MAQYSDRDEWESLSAARRCRVIGGAAAGIVDASQQLVTLCASDQRTDPVETVTAELIPLCSAIRFIGRRGSKILRSRRCGWIGRPVWLWGVRSEVHRQPHGTVLILGTWNYPLLLAGVQTAQALAAGNRVLLKPAPGTESITTAWTDAFYRSGVPRECLRVLDASTQSAIDAIDAGVDLIVLTGAAPTGRKVLQRAAESLTPTIMELSGCDAVVLMPSVFQSRSHRQRAARAVAFGLTLNGGATCIAPRRLIVEDRAADGWIELLREELKMAGPAKVHPAARSAAAAAIDQAIHDGAVDCFRSFDKQQLMTGGTLRPVLLDQVSPNHPIAAADIFAPVSSIIRVDDIDDAVEIINHCPYRLAASVFGTPQLAGRLASRLSVGSIVINDLIVPTADPRLPFGGRANSGFGVTRGAEGLLAMTVPTVISRRRGRFAPHLQSRRSSDAETLLGALQMLHARSLAGRVRGIGKMIRSRRQGPSAPSTSAHNEGISFKQGSQS